jgi:tetratricopeptide (TPR) repeat protein
MAKNVGNTKSDGANLGFEADLWKAAEEATQRRRAEDNLRSVLALVNGELQFLDNTKRSRMNMDADQMAAIAGNIVSALETLRADRLHDADHLERLAFAHLYFGDVVAPMSRFTEADNAYRQALAINATFESEFPERAKRLHGSWFFPPDVYMKLAEVQRADGRPEEAEGSYRQAERSLATFDFAKGDAGPEEEFLAGQARCLLAAGRIEDAEALYCRALQSNPSNEIVHLGYAWFLATSPQAKYRDPDRVGEHLDKVSRWGPFAYVVEGAAKYRAGDWKAAKSSLCGTIPNIVGAKEGGIVRTQEGQENGAGFFLAMAHWQLGEKDKALERFKEAVAWTDSHRPKDVELLRIRAEAVKLLEIKSD